MQRAQYQKWPLVGQSEDDPCSSLQSQQSSCVCWHNINSTEAVVLLLVFYFLTIKAGMLPHDVVLRSAMTIRFADSGDKGLLCSAELDAALA